MRKKKPDTKQYDYRIPLYNVVGQAELNYSYRNHNSVQFSRS